MIARASVEPKRLAALVDGFRGRRIAVLADLVCDEFVYGDIARVSREAPVLILEHARTDVVPGGGANAVANLRALGAMPVPVGVVGRDEGGARLVRALRTLGVPTDGILVAPGYGTPTKSRILAGGVHTRRQQIVRVDRGSPHGELPPALRARLRARLGRVAPGCEGLLVADYGYGAAVPALVRATSRVWRGKVITVDSRERIAQYRGMTACTPNQEELERAAGLGGRPSVGALAAAARDLARRTADGAVLVTRGAAGMLLVPRRGPARAIPAFGSREVADVTGAGDTVVASLTLALVAGATPEEAAVLANVAAGLVVMKYGTATVTPHELRAALRSGRPA